MVLSKVSDEVERLISELSASSSIMLKTTLPVGFVFKTTSKVSVDPASLTVDEPPDSVTVNPAESTSMTFTLND